MCEFTVILNKEIVFKDAVYAKVENDHVILKDVLGNSKQFDDCKIIEVDVNNTKMVLASVKERRS